MSAELEVSTEPVTDEEAGRMLVWCAEQDDRLRYIRRLANKAKRTRSETYALRAVWRAVNVVVAHGAKE